MGYSDNGQGRGQVMWKGEGENELVWNEWELVS
jgi:hypothetical protein